MTRKETFSSRFKETRGGRVPKKFKIWGDVFYGWSLRFMLKTAKSVTKITFYQHEGISKKKDYGPLFTNIFRPKMVFSDTYRCGELMSRGSKLKSELFFHWSEKITFFDVIKNSQGLAQTVEQARMPEFESDAVRL